MSSNFLRPEVIKHTNIGEASIGRIIVPAALPHSYPEWSSSAGCCDKWEGKLRLMEVHRMTETNGHKNKVL